MEKYHFYEHNKNLQTEYVILHQFEGLYRQESNVEKQGMLKDITYPEYIFIFL